MCRQRLTPYIVESILHWKHYLSWKRFTLITDQKSVSFMFDNKCAGKIKNDKIEQCRLELAEYNFDIQYPPEENLPADSLTRLF